MYYQLGRFDPSNQFIRDYRNEDVLQLYEDLSMTKQIYANKLIQIYIVMHNIEEGVKLNKTKNSDKNKNKAFRFKTLSP